MKFIIAALALVASTAFAQSKYSGSPDFVNINLSGRLNEAKGVAVNTGATTDLSSVAGNLVHVVGTTTITSFGTASQAGIMRHVIFDGVTSVFNGSSLVIPGNANIITEAGDSAVVVADSLTKWIIFSYTRKAVAP